MEVKVQVEVLPSSFSCSYANKVRFGPRVVARWIPIDGALSAEGACQPEIVRRGLKWLRLVVWRVPATVLSTLSAGQVTGGSLKHKVPSPSVAGGGRQVADQFKVRGLGGQKVVTSGSKPTKPISGPYPTVSTGRDPTRSPKSGPQMDPVHTNSSRFSKPGTNMARVHTDSFQDQPVKGCTHLATTTMQKSKLKSIVVSQREKWVGPSFVMPETELASSEVATLPEAIPSVLFPLSTVMQPKAI
ncbi:hypothetical protein QJS10_CPA08g00524 [Acorus calamus]|uniref:Uncharacterized protein n=1 Tax=Acorus calamus TaxID=4465 RepID=A0AAV9EBR6_ACOCL|nr:hypothetical protein QJS10_CPA08g00524 [Acorus calamus]